MTARTITNSRLVDWAKLDNITVTLPIDLDDLTPWGTQAVTNVSDTYAILTTDWTVNCTENSFTLTLPTAVWISGKIYNLKNSGSGTITLNTTSSQKIDGYTSGSLSLSQFDNYQVQSDWINWIIL